MTIDDFVVRLGSGTAGDISSVAITSLSNSRVVAAMRNGSGDLQLIVWDIDGNGNLTRRGSGTAGAISFGGDHLSQRFPRRCCDAERIG